MGVAEHATDKPIKRNKCQVLAPLSVAVNVAGVFASSLLFMPLRSKAFWGWRGFEVRGAGMLELAMRS